MYLKHLLLTIFLTANSSNAQVAMNSENSTLDEYHLSGPVATGELKNGQKIQFVAFQPPKKLVKFQNLTEKEQNYILYTLKNQDNYTLYAKIFLGILSLASYWGVLLYAENNSLINFVASFINKEKTENRKKLFKMYEEYIKDIKDEKLKQAVHNILLTADIGEIKLKDKDDFNTANFDKIIKDLSSAGDMVPQNSKDDEKRTQLAKDVRNQRLVAYGIQLFGMIYSASYHYMFDLHHAIHTLIGALLPLGATLLLSQNHSVYDTSVLVTNAIVILLLNFAIYYHYSRIYLINQANNLTSQEIHSMLPNPAPVIIGIVA